MPRGKSHSRSDVTAVQKKIWVLYSSNRQFCFQQEIHEGVFPSGYACGCSGCMPTMELPKPEFTRLRGEAT